MIIIPYYTDARQKSHGGVPSIYTHRKSDTLPVVSLSSTIYSNPKLFSISRAILNNFLCVSILTYFGEIKFMFVSKKLK